MIQRCLLVGALALAVVSCSDSTGPAVPEQIELGVPASIVMTAGASDTVTVVVRDGSGNPLNAIPVVWTSSNDIIVSVDSAGVLTADSSGIATVTAWLDTLQASFDVTVVQTIQSLVVEPADTTFQMWNSIPLRVLALDGAGRNVAIVLEQLTFSTSDSSVLIPDSAGNVFGSGWGGAVITVKADTLSSSITLHSAPEEVDLGGVQLVNFDMGSQYFCGKDVAAELYCWGQNEHGQLGIADTLAEEVLLPTIVPGGSAYVQYGTGEEHTCGLSAAGAIWCWGYNGRAALGLGHRGPDSRVPVRVSGNHVWRSLSVGKEGTTCGTTDANIPYCWGHNDNFQVGREPISAYDSLVAPVSGGHEMTAIDMSFHSVCGLSPQGQPLCWGRDISTATNGLTHALPRPVTSPPLVSIFVGGSSYECGLTSSNEAWCWGFTPDPIAGIKKNIDAVAFAPSLRFAKLSVFDDYGCGITTDGDLHCWGLQHNWPDPTSAPRMGEPGMKFLDVNLTIPACALTTEHRMYCWSAARGMIPHKVP